MGSTETGSVAGQLVGRDRELGELAKALGAEECRVVAVGGIGGIGKSALVASFSSWARGNGVSVVRIDGRDTEPTPAGVLGAVAAAAGTDDTRGHAVAARLGGLAERVVLVVENYERLRLADGFVRDEFGPQLPRSVLLVLVGRDRLVMPWFTDPGWVGRVRSIELGALDEPASLAYLTALGLDERSARSTFRATGGHPLAMTMAAGLIAHGTDPGTVQATTGAVVNALAADYLATVPDPTTRTVLEAASVLRRVTESLARALLPDHAPSENIDRLQALPFVEVGVDGLVIHDVVREAVAKRLATIAPDRYQQYRQAAWIQLRAEMAAVPRSMLWRYTADLLHLLDAAELREAFFPTGRQPLVVEPARAHDTDSIDSIMSAHCKPQEAEALRAWWTHAPHTFAVCRNDSGDLVGFRIVAARRDISADLAEADPVAAVWAADLEHLPASAEVLMFRRLLDIDAGEANSASRASFGLDLKRTYMEMRPRLRYLYNLGANPDEMQWAPMLGFEHREELTVDLDGQTFHTWRLDMGIESVDGWLARLAADAIGIARDAPDVFDQSNHQLSRSDGERIDLTPLEYSVMNALWSRQGHPVSRADLLTEVWGYDSNATSNVVDTLIAALRRKLGPDRHQIETVRGVGYRHQPNKPATPSQGPPAWACCGLTDIHHQGLGPGKDAVHYGERGT